MANQKRFEAPAIDFAQALGAGQQAETALAPQPTVGGALRANAPALDMEAQYQDPGAAEMVGGYLDDMNAGPRQVPRPESLEPMTVGEVLKRQLVGMIPFYGPAHETVERQKEAAAAQDWKSQQELEDTTWKQRQEFYGPIVEQEIKENREIQRKVSQLKFLRNVFPNATDDMMANFARQVYGMPKMDRKNVRVVTPWAPQGMPAMQDETGQVIYRDEMGNTSIGLPGTDQNVLKVLPMISGDEASGMNKWQADRAMKFALYNRDVLHNENPNYVPSDLDYAEAEKHWNSRVGGDSVAREKYVAMVEAFTGKKFEDTTAAERHQAEMTTQRQLAGARAESGIQFIKTVGEDGETVLTPARKTPGTTWEVPRSAAEISVDNARVAIVPQIQLMRALSDRVISRVGPKQRADAIKRGTEAVFGKDPDFRAYTDVREGLAVNIAKIINGGRPSDPDRIAAARAYLPDPYRDTRESAELKWQFMEIAMNPKATIRVTTNGGTAVANLPVLQLGDYLAANPGEDIVIGNRVLRRAR
jgi:hypothetical protein